MPEFSLVLRGYNTHQVDEVVAQVEGTLGRRRLEGGPITFKQLTWTSFEVVMRGYDRFEVDGVMRGYRNELAAHEGVELPADEPASDNSLAIVLGEPVEDHGEIWTPRDPEQEFPIRFRGYDRHQVDRLIARARATLGHTGGSDGEPVTREELNNPGFDLVLRGYDRREVDIAIGRYLKELLDRA
jgi:DivIVA domain-containing protein